ncbi:MAG: uroporphyrinogen decarboxylase family protein [Candidatus Zhuqueibacterota bacterium]
MGRIPLPENFRARIPGHARYHNILLEFILKRELNFNRLRTALFGGVPDCVPLLELAIADSIKQRYIGRPIAGVREKIEFAQKAGYDYVRLAPKIDLNPGKIAPKEGARKSHSTAQTGERNWHASSQGMITTVAEFEQFQWPSMESVNYSEFEAAQSALPDGMKIIGQYGDIFTWTWDFMGFETFSFALIDNPALVAALFDKIGAIVLELFETMADFDAIGAFFYSDDIAINTGLFVAPQVYRQYLFPWMKKIGAICQRRNIPFIYHTDGNIWEVLDDLKDCRVNALQPVEPHAMDIVELKAKRGRDFCLVGNVDVDLLSRGTTRQVEDEVKRLLRQVAQGGGFCLGSGNTVPDYAIFENYLAMIETGKTYGRYPISF